MITNIHAKNLKGLEFSQDLKEKNIIVGPNGSGKTAISIAAMLTIYGQVPGVKTNPDIMAAFGSGKLTVGAKVNGTLLDRQWSESSKGSISQTYLIGRKKATKDDFITALAEAGNPKIFNLPEFMALSDQKKIEYIFTLFPPADDIGKLDDEISELKEKLNSKRKRLNDGENFIKKSLSERSGIDLPAGTAAEVSGEIEKTEIELAAARSSLEKAKQEEIEAEQKEREKKLKEEADAREKQMVEENLKKQADLKAETEALEKKREAFRKEVETTNNVLQGQGLGSAQFRPEKFPHIEGLNYWQEEGTKSIQAIIDAIDRLLCPKCRENSILLLVAQKELKRWLRKEAA